LTPAGYFGGLNFTYNPDKLNNIKPSTFSQPLQYEGVPIKVQKSGNVEYRRNLFTQRYDLWGDQRGPINDAWQGLEDYSPPKPEEFPHSEYLSKHLFTLPCFIEVDQNYYKAFKKIEILKSEN
jgi:perosamine synthetase